MLSTQPVISADALASIKQRKEELTLQHIKMQAERNRARGLKPGPGKPLFEGIDLPVIEGSIAAKLKSHQLAAVQFIWMNLVSGHAKMDQPEDRPLGNNGATTSAAALATAGGGGGGGLGQPKDPIASRMENRHLTTDDLDNWSLPETSTRGADKTAAAVEDASEPGGCILAHYMGLGKSFTSIAFLHTYFSLPPTSAVPIRRVLLVVPPNVLMKFFGEFPKFLPNPIDDLDDLDDDKEGGGIRSSSLTRNKASAISLIHV